MHRFILPVVIAVTASQAIADPISDARATLVRAAFATSDKTQAIALINKALGDLNGIVARTPSSEQALIQQGIAYAYRGQLTRSPGDAKQGRDILTGLATRFPNDPEAQGALGGWHLTVITTVGSFIGSTVLGASKSKGLKAIDKAVALGGNRAFFPAYAGMLRLTLDSSDPSVAGLLGRAAAGQTPTEIDRINKDSAAKVAAVLRTGDTAGAAKLAARLLPFGRVQ